MSRNSSSVAELCIFLFRKAAPGCLTGDSLSSLLCHSAWQRGDGAVGWGTESWRMKGRWALGDGLTPAFRTDEWGGPEVKTAGGSAEIRRARWDAAWPASVLLYSIVSQRQLSLCVWAIHHACEEPHFSQFESQPPEPCSIAQQWKADQARHVCSLLPSVFVSLSGS